MKDEARSDAELLAATARGDDGAFARCRLRVEAYIRFLEMQFDIPDEG